MTTKHTAMTSEALLIKLSVQQRHDFGACARACGLTLEAWVVQCADVHAAAATDALQAGMRGQRPDRKKQRPRLQVRKRAENTAAKSATMKAARAYNARFERRGEETNDGQEIADV